jgi:hypothetical protein
MRIWSIHPKYLDSRGLVALWRETLLAKHVLEGKTRGYNNHPQLKRFKDSEHPVDGINQYLAAVYDEAVRRGYNFDRKKIDWNYVPVKMTVTRGQLKYETAHLLKKLKIRDIIKYEELTSEKELLSHPLFDTIDGNVEEWEIIKF